VGEGKESARAQVLTARALVDEELVRLEASARAAVDIKAKVRRNPVKAAGLAAGAGFLVVGGPRRVLRGTRNAIFGRPAPLPESMLPKEIDASLKKLGTDGERVRGLVEREFATYLRNTEPERKHRDFSRAMSIVLIAAVRPFVLGYSKRLAAQLMATDGKEYSDRLEKVRARVTGDTGPGVDTAPGVDPGQKPAP
jgi:hypothetical protein